MINCSGEIKKKSVRIGLNWLKVREAAIRARVPAAAPGAVFRRCRGDWWCYGCCTTNCHQLQAVDRAKGADVLEHSSSRSSPLAAHSSNAVSSSVRLCACVCVRTTVVFLLHDHKVCEIWTSKNAWHGFLLPLTRSPAESTSLMSFAVAVTVRFHSCVNVSRNWSHS